MEKRKTCNPIFINFKSKVNKIVSIAQAQFKMLDKDNF